MAISCCNYIAKRCLNGFTVLDFLLFACSGSQNEGSFTKPLLSHVLAAVLWSEEGNFPSVASVADAHQWFLMARSYQLQTLGTYCFLYFFFSLLKGTQTVPVWFRLTVGARCLCVKLIRRRSALKGSIICIYHKTDKGSIILSLPSSCPETEKSGGLASPPGEFTMGVKSRQCVLDKRLWRDLLGQCPSLGSFSDDLKCSPQKQVPLSAANIRPRF